MAEPTLHQRLLDALAMPTPIGYLVGVDPQRFIRPADVEIVHSPDAVTQAAFAAALRAVVELHAPIGVPGDEMCGGCQHFGAMVGQPWVRLQDHPGYR